MEINGTTAHRREGQTALYGRLPRGPHGMSREQVARNQRARLYGAMVESISLRGYRSTTVADLTALAGVSRRSFYEHFSNKEQCLLATNRSLLARQRKRLIEAWRAGHGSEERLRLACERLVSDVAAYPKGPRLVLVDSLGIGGAARAHLQLTGAAFECLVAAVLAPGTGAGDPDGVSSRAIVGGVRHVLFLRVRERRERELQALGAELLDWMTGYRTPATGRLARLEPRARSAPFPRAAFLAGTDRRARVLRSVTRLALEAGCAALTDGRIAELAEIAPAQLRREFGDAEACFLALLDEFAGEGLRRVGVAFQSAYTWQEAVDRSLAAFVGHLLAHRALLRLAFVELFALGPRIVGRLTAPVEQVAGMIVGAAPAPRCAPSLAREALTGAIWSLIAARAASGRRLQATCLTDQLAYAALAPHLGARRAVEAIAAVRRSPPPP